MICDGFSEAKTALIRKKVGRNHSSLFYVTAAWVVDSIQAGKRLSEGLFPPRGLKELNGKSMQSFIRKSVDGNDKEGEEEVNNVLRNYDFDSTKVLRQIGSDKAKESSIAESVVNPLASRSTAALNTSDDPNFLSHFFANSRLHFIGTWRNRLPQFAKRLMIKHPHLTEGRKGLSSRSCDEPSERLVLHIDMDCFFVSVLLRSHPHLVHKPVAVAHGYSAGCEVSSCNYPARALGVKNGMWMQSAKLLCPELVVLKYDFYLYETVSEQVYNIFYSTPEAIIVQPVSVDEAYIEVRPDVDALALAATIRERVYSETQCPCSAGIGPNMLLAKYLETSSPFNRILGNLMYFSYRIATKRAKPDGQFQISYQNLESVLYDLPTNELPGVGWKVSRTLADHQLHCIRDLVLLSESELQSIAGVSMGSFLFRACRGMDERELVAIPARSSVSIDVNWGLRFQENAKAEEFLGQLAFETTRRLDEVVPLYRLCSSVSAHIAL